jgi:hypothetical protein
MKALVSGAAGFIGSQLCRVLLARGDEVTALLLPGEPRTRLDALPIPAVVELDLAAADASDLDSLLVQARPDVVFHLAWYAHPRDYLTSPENLRSLAFARRHGAPGGAGLRRRVPQARRRRDLPRVRAGPQTRRRERHRRPAEPVRLGQACGLARPARSRRARGRRSRLGPRLPPLRPGRASSAARAVGPRRAALRTPDRRHRWRADA